MDVDVTREMLNYREAARHLWAAHFLPVMDPKRLHCAVHQFADVCSMLYIWLVAQPRHLQVGCWREFEPTPWNLRVIIEHDRVVPIQVSRNKGEHTYWDYPLEKVSGAGLEFEFQGFLDWDEIDHRDFEYAKLRITRFDGNEALVDHLALIKPMYCRWLGLLMESPAG